jgi:uncharacterized protein YhhL (DUF1145 family)
MTLLFEIIAVILGVLAVRLVDIIHPFTGDARVGVILVCVFVVKYLLGYIPLNARRTTP